MACYPVDATDQDTRYHYQYYLTPTGGSEVELPEPSLAELAWVIKAGTCIEASFKRGKGEVGMDEYQVRTWQGWHHHMVLSLMVVWFLIGETHRGSARDISHRTRKCMPQRKLRRDIQ